MHHTIYLTTNTINGKVYVGYHYTKNPNDSYLGSGKLILRAINKYGKSAFIKTILALFETKDSAEAFEAFIVDKPFTLRNDTYNINIGGNVRVSYGENNGFYGKHHTKRNRDNTSIRTMGNKYFSDTHNYKIQNVNTGDIYIDMKETMKYENIKSKWKLVYAIGEGRLKYLDEDRQLFTMALYEERSAKREINKKRLASEATKRFKGISLKKSHKNKIGKKVKEYINTHPEEHTAKMLKINKNPEKIRKTAAKHTGMKRSPEARANMKASQRNRTWNPIKGKTAAYDPKTKIVKFFFNIIDIPKDWIKGNCNIKSTYSGRIIYNDGTVKTFNTLREVANHLEVTYPEIHKIIGRKRPEKFGYKVEKFIQHNTI
jgi:hypothetical protein